MTTPVKNLRRVSVILPTYNRAAQLPRAITSVLNQTHKDLELIVVDDASTDATGQTVRAIDDERLHYVRLADNVGAAGARNEGYARATGAYVAFQDSDNIFYPDKLSRQLDVLARAPDDVAACVCGVRQVIGHKITDVSYGSGEKPREQTVHELLERWVYPGQSLLVRREAMDAVGGWDPALPRAQDFDLCIRLLEHGRFLFVAEVLVELHFSEDSITADPERLETAIDAIIDKHATLFAANPRGRSWQQYRVAKGLAFAGHHRRALAWAARALKTNPINWRAYILFGASLTHSAGLMRRIKG